VLRLLMPIAVVGKEKPVKVYEVMGLAREFEPADLSHLQQADDKYGTMDENGTASDVASTVSTQRKSNTADGSRYSEVDGAGRTRRKRKAIATTTAMLRDAAMKTASDVPLTCTQHEILLSKQASKAVHLYIDGRFADAISALDALESMVPAYLYDGDSKATPEGPQGAPSGTNGDGNDNAPLVRCAGAARRSLDLVRGLCEKYLREGTPADFDGVYRALEK